MSGCELLMRRCSAEGVTLHGALAAAMTMAIGPAAAQHDSGRICIGSPINIRSELDPPVAGDEVGAYAAMTQSILRFGGDQGPVGVDRPAGQSFSTSAPAISSAPGLALCVALHVSCFGS